MSITLVTSFQPFQDRHKNGSTTILRWLRRRWDKGLQRSRILPVDWKKAPSSIGKLASLHLPTRILGIGEGRPGRVAWETVAKNHCLGTDNAGLVLSDRPIEIDGPPTLSSTWLPPGEKLISLLGGKVEFVQSEDAGSFLCNRLLWTGLRTNAEQVAFLHLPPQEERTDEEYQKLLGPFVLAVLKDG